MRSSKIVLIISISVACTSALNFVNITDISNVVHRFYGEVSVNSSNVCERYIASLPLVSKLKLFDSSAKIPSGIFILNLNDYGSYEGCINIEEKIQEKLYHGKYCFGKFNFRPGELFNQLGDFQSLKKKNDDTNKNTTITFNLGYCLLDFCTHEDFQKIFPWATFQENYCYSDADKRSLDNWDITAICVFAIFAIVVVLSTIYDVYLFYKKIEPYHIIFFAFSLWSNGKKIFTSSYNSDQLTCINGLKAVSITWIVYSHVHLYGMMYSVDNMMDLVLTSKEKKNVYIMSATLTVDTFFAIGGMLLVYTAFKANDKGVKINVLMMYVHRYLRLTPALGAMWLFQSSLLRYVSSGPQAGVVNERIRPCREHWWSTLLYVQNWFNDNDICVGQSWYLSADMQIFLVTPLVLVPLIKWRKIGLMILMALAIAGIVVPFTVTYVYDLKSSLALDDRDDQSPYMEYYYLQPFSRFGPYVIGMIFGYIIYTLKYKKPDGKMTSKKLMTIVAIYCIAITGLLACTYGNAGVFVGTTRDIISRSFHNGFNRNAWAFSVCLIITLCALHGGPINAFLSNPVFQFLAKISYAIYLTHITVIEIRLMNSKTVSHFSARDFTDAFWGDYMNTVIISFFLTAVFESPVIILEKVIFGKAPLKNKN